MVSTSDNKSVRTIGRCVGLNKRSLKIVVQCMKLLEIKITGKKWAKGDKKCRRDVPPEITIVIVLEWWTYETRVSPNKKKVITNLIARNVKEMHAKHYMQKNEGNSLIHSYSLN